ELVRETLGDRDEAEGVDRAFGFSLLVGGGEEGERRPGARVLVHGVSDDDEFGSASPATAAVLEKCAETIRLIGAHGHGMLRSSERRGRGTSRFEDRTAETIRSAQGESVRISELRCYEEIRGWAVPPV